MSSSQPPTAGHHDDPRPDVHNSEISESAAALGLCGVTHLATGRVCLLPERHIGGCDFESPPDRPAT